MSDYTQAKTFLKAINDLKIKGIKKVNYVGLKKDAMIEKFMDTVEAVDDAGKLAKLPDELVTFYEGLVEEADGEEEVEEVEDDDPEDDDPEEDDPEDDDPEEDDPEEDEVEEDDYEDVEDDDPEDDDPEDDDPEEDEVEDEEEEEPEPPKKKKPAKKKPAAKKPAKKAKPEKKKPAAKKPAKKAKPEKKKPAKKKKAETTEAKPRTIKATTRMSARIDTEKEVLTLIYGDNKKRLKVQNTDKAKLKKTIAKAVAYAKEWGATHGQIQAVKKSFTTNGYHVLR